MQTGLILLLLMWKVFMSTIIWKSVTATLRSSGFSKNRESSVKEFLCFGTHENLSSPLDNDNAWNTLVWQLGMFWVGMDICLHNCLIKEKEWKREKHFNMKILHCHIPPLFHYWTTLNCCAPYTLFGKVLTSYNTGRQEFAASQLLSTATILAVVHLSRFTA